MLIARERRPNLIWISLFTILWFGILDRNWFRVNSTIRRNQSGWQKNCFVTWCPFFCRIAFIYCFNSFWIWYLNNSFVYSEWEATLFHFNGIVYNAPVWNFGRNKHKNSKKSNCFNAFELLEWWVPLVFGLFVSNCILLLLEFGMHTIQNKD